MNTSCGRMYNTFGYAPSSNFKEVKECAYLGNNGLLLATRRQEYRTLRESFNSFIICKPGVMMRRRITQVRRARTSSRTLKRTLAGCQQVRATSQNHQRRLSACYFEPCVSRITFDKHYLASSEADSHGCKSEYEPTQPFAAPMMVVILLSTRAYSAHPFCLLT